MASWQEEPYTGQSVWDDFKNGIIEGIDYESHTIYVSYYEKGRKKYTFDDFFGNFDEKLNQWILLGEI
jgi:hypothetical protein